MSHEVVKVVGGRAYRYVVERVPDPMTGKTRRRWRYVGVAANARPADAPPSDDGLSTRDRLLAAFERLLADRSFSDVTISAVGREAGLAHGTFYRYFRDKEALLEAAVERVREDVQALEPRFEGDVASSDAERERVERWLTFLTTIPTRRTALVRAWYLHREAMGDLALARRARKMGQVGRLTHYLHALDVAGLARIADARSLALGIATAIDGVMQRALIENETLDAETIAALRSIVLRAVFGPEG